MTSVQWVYAGIIGAFTLFGLAWVALWWIQRISRARGAAEVNDDMKGKTLEDVKKAHLARERLRAGTDPALANRLRQLDRE